MFAVMVDYIRVFNKEKYGDGRFKVLCSAAKVLGLWV